MRGGAIGAHAPPRHPWVLCVPACTQQPHLPQVPWLTCDNNNYNSFSWRHGQQLSLNRAQENRSSRNISTSLPSTSPPLTYISTTSSRSSTPASVLLRAQHWHTSAQRHQGAAPLPLSSTGPALTYISSTPSRRSILASVFYEPSIGLHQLNAIKEQHPCLCLLRAQHWHTSAQRHQGAAPLPLSSTGPALAHISSTPSRSSIPASVFYEPSIGTHQLNAIKEQHPCLCLLRAQHWHTSAQRHQGAAPLPLSSTGPALAYISSTSSRSSTPASVFYEPSIGLHQLSAIKEQHPCLCLLRAQHWHTSDQRHQG